MKIYSHSDLSFMTIFGGRFALKILSKIFFFQLTYAYFVTYEGNSIHTRNTKVKQRRRYFEQVRTISCAVRSGQSITFHESVTGKQCSSFAFFMQLKAVSQKVSLAEKNWQVKNACSPISSEK